MGKFFLTGMKLAFDLLSRSHNEKILFLFVLPFHQIISGSTTCRASNSAQTFITLKSGQVFNFGSVGEYLARVGVKSLKKELNPNPSNFFSSKSFHFQKYLNPN